MSPSVGLGGDPVKIEAAVSASEAETVEWNEESVAESPAATPMKLELPVKLLRMDASVQIAQYEQEQYEQDPSEFGIPQRSISLPNPWTSPLADAWESPWGHWLPGYQFDPLGFEAGVLDELGFEQPPGLAMEGNEPLSLSQGPGMHGHGQCRPCAWFWKPGSCQNADNCSYCHLCPEGELKQRKKNKVAMMRLGIVTPKAKHERDLNGNVLRLSPLL